MYITQSLPTLSTTVLRNQFHTRAAAEGAFVCAEASRAMYLPHAEQLSIKAAYGGCEHYFVDGERRGVDDDVYMIINQGHEYSSRLDCNRPVLSIALVFSDEMQASALRCMQQTDEALLDQPFDTGSQSSSFDEHLRINDSIVSPVIRYLAAMCRQGVSDPMWYDEHARFLLERLITRRRNDRSFVERLAFVRRGTKQEIHRRVQRASDFMLTCYAQKITLREIAAVACLAPHHFLRVFRTVAGVTPFQYLACKRVAVGMRLLRDTLRPVDEVARQCGFNDRNSMTRAFRLMLNSSPGAVGRELRRAVNDKRPELKTLLSEILA
ncbi:MAG: helix-turn-helix domain-containing protein [Steroidobacter sp.]